MKRRFATSHNGRWSNMGTACCGRRTEARQSLFSTNPEVRAVVLDLAMPVMSGDTAGRIMRSLHPEVPVILSSGDREWDVL